jgi:NAD(P)H dehydrogenase (quinone)
VPRQVGAEGAQAVGDLRGCAGRLHEPVPAAELGPAAFELVAAGLFAEPSDDLEKLISRPATGLRAAVETALRG